MSERQMSESIAAKHPLGATLGASLGALVAEGKTKKIHLVKGSSDRVTVVAKDDITAGDGAKHDIIPAKGRLATATTCNVFRLLKACVLPVAFVEQDSAISFVAPKCDMLPYEVVVRREAHGSYLKRNPHLSKGQLFPQALVEFYLKTKDKNWKGRPLVADDPFMQFVEDAKQIRLFNPAKPLQGQEPFLVLAGSEVFGRDQEGQIFPEMRRIARQAFLVLEGGSYIDKQVYRDGGALDDVVAKYRHVAEITSHFRVPRQRIVLWRGSEKDSPDAFLQALGELKDMMTVVTCSVHKEPVNAAGIFHRMMQEIPDSVVIAYIGRSNGAGPTLSAMSTVPVITVPASIKEFPDDLWSSLRAPSAVPVMTVLDPANAVLAALQILSGRNPRLYAHVRGEIENRTVNTIQL